MTVLFYLGHPAHYHLFKNQIKFFKREGHQVHILIKKKDVLEDLLKEEGLDYMNIFPHTRGDSKIAMTKTILKRNYRLMRYCFKSKPDLLIGTSVENSHIGKLLNIPSINVNEDDHDVVPLYSKLSYPLSNVIVSPTSCSTGRWEHKTIHYKGYHELAYLHPNHFVPDIKVIHKYFQISRPYFIIRFARLKAHHDKGIAGINNQVAMRLIKTLEPHGNVYITSEKPLVPELDKYRLYINPIDMHHVLAFARLYIGDSQTMAAESGVLGTPFIRFNDFVGRIGYLNELENKYRLGFGVKPGHQESLFEILQMLIHDPSLEENFDERRRVMLNERIDVNLFFRWFIENFPQSKTIMKNREDFQYQFRSYFKPSLQSNTELKIHLRNRKPEKVII